ncbi:MAG: methyl-accepting chemotaxis protein [Clostridia bacterium]|jgi:CBS domain-containing protein|nr:methyl-accepting chemotaxis protein [Clostridia bacterium]
MSVELTNIYGVMGSEDETLKKADEITKENQEIMEKLAFALPIFQTVLDKEIGVALVDTEKFVFYYPAKDFDLKDRAGYPLKEGSGIYKAVKNKIPHLKSRPDRKLYGVGFISNAGAVFNSRGDVIGGITITQSTTREDAVREMAENLLNNISTLASTAEEITAESQEISSVSKTMADISEQSQDNINETGTVLELINGIAKQTNLLGLNAAIEAARVGELGRGFGVVADEIRSLATSSTESVTKIKKIIQTIMTDSQTTNESIRQVENGISQMAEAITQMASSIEELQSMADLLYQRAETF